MDVNVEKNRYIILTKTIEGRSFLYNLVQESCGFNLTDGATILKDSHQFDLGRMHVGMEIYNCLVKYCPGVLKQMEKESDEYGEY